MTPLKIEILLWYHYSPKDFRDLDAPAIKEAINEFVEAGILNKNNSSIDERLYIPNHIELDLYINALTKVPLPKQVWAI